jgi:pSer/pThr/pTyr-binding forkhead associated (FHA) protein
MPGSALVLRHARGLPHASHFGERLRLLVIEGQDRGTCFSAFGDTLFVGREGCQISLHDANISRKHAELLWRGDHYVLRDLGSANGVLRNGQKLKEFRLHAGDMLLIGLTVLEVCLPGQKQRAKKLHVAPPPPPEVKPTITPEVARKRVFTMIALFFAVAGAYLFDRPETVHGSVSAPPVELEETPQERADRLRQHGDPTQLIKDTDEQIAQIKKALVKAEGRRERLAGAREMQDKASGALLDALEKERSRAPSGDADLFFRAGVRELQNKNYTRAFSNFNTALAVDPHHELSKLYLTSAKISLLGEVRALYIAGVQARASRRQREAKMNFENVLRYLANDALDLDANKDLRNIKEEAAKALAEIEAAERPKIAE